MKTEIPDPNDSWAQIEIYRYQYGYLPGENSDGMEPINISEGLRGMANALNNPDQSKWPKPFNVASVLTYAAKVLESKK